MSMLEYTPPGSSKELKDAVAEMAAGARAFEATASSIIERAKIGPIFDILKELESQVAEMEMPPRFSSTRKAGEGMGGLHPNTAPTFMGLTEAEYKRQQLLLGLRTVRSQLGTAVDNLRIAVLDIEATKQTK